MIQGSNSPIVLKADVDFTQVQRIKAALFCGRKVAKTWDETTAIATTADLILPMTESETADIKAGTATLEVKWLDDGCIRFAEVVSIPIVARSNLELFDVGASEEDSGDEYPLIEDPVHMINIDMTSTWMELKNKPFETLGDAFVIRDGTLDIDPTRIAGAQGEQGPKGDTGEAGHTPVKGVDYWTASDQSAIVSAVLSELPDASEVEY